MCYNEIMKENRIGIISTGIISIITFFTSIIFSLFDKDWCMNFSFALMGSAILSFVICLVNYLIIRKRMIEDLVNGIYKYNNETMAQLYTLSKKIEIENLSLVIGIACSHLNNLIYLAYNIKIGLFKSEKKKIKIVDDIINDLEVKIQFKFNSIGQYLLKRPKKSERFKDYFYKMIYKLLEDKRSYKLAFQLAKSVKTEAKTVEEAFGESQKKFETKICDLLEKEIKIIQLNNEIKEIKNKKKEKTTK